MAKKLKTAQEYFDFFTKDFESDPDPKEIWIEGNNNSWMLQEYRIPLPETLKVRHPYIIFIIFVYLKKFGFSGIGEKVAWEIPVKYNGTPFILSHRKFGFQIASSEENETIKNHGIEVMMNIHKAMPFAESLIEPHIKSLMQKGLVTLDNEYQSIRNRYTFYRENAEKEFNDTKKSPKSLHLNFNEGIKEAVKSWNTAQKSINTGNYYMFAMLDAYFSLLEHTLVLLLPFLNYINLSEIDLENFISKNWKSKFKIAFPPKTDIQALKILERLDRVKERFRNPLTHGYFLKQGLSFYIQMDHIGAIPMTLTKPNRNFKYSFGRIDHMNFNEICKCFDDCDNFLLKNKLTKFGMRYIQHDLSIAFDSDSCKEYRTAMTTMKMFDEFIYHMGRKHDDASNMDW